MVNHSSANESIIRPRFLPGGSALSKSHTDRIAQAEHDMAMQGKRILGFARGASMDALEFAGLIALYDPPRPGVRESVATLKTSGVRVRPRILLYFTTECRGKKLT